ncbi:DoxX family protein [Candidatus Falkowbacteria bacterium]|jgi:uncharacterized membrane protein YphA (DoxX/SURF4 family)|nr:DoxX family protein [Candidatus Falkowbacteria bacterium]
MSLEISKINKIVRQPEDLLRIFLAFVFLTAGLFRIFNYDLAIAEFSFLRMPVFLCPLVIIFEIGAGIFLLFNKYVKQVYLALIVFLIFVLSLALVIRGEAMIASAGELFVFDLTATDWFLHFVFLLIAVMLLAKKK